MIGTMCKDEESLVQITFIPEFKIISDPRSNITDQRGHGEVCLDSKTHHIRQFVLRHSVHMTDPHSESDVDLEYSATLLQGE